MSRVEVRVVVTASVFVLSSGGGWRHLPPSFEVTAPRAHRRFTEWTRAGLWRRLHQAVLDELGAARCTDSQIPQVRTDATLLEHVGHEMVRLLGEAASQSRRVMTKVSPLPSMPLPSTSDTAHR